MRLKHLKLAGFKSFVDPTIIPFTQSLSAVVGPNGCGKSNIIDAVRWVLGESSAKNLRGDDMSDVIFNGSSARKPVSVASVELLFDNSDGRAQGPWEKFSEIAIKRQVSRQGQSDYFVNGQKCRRRDISDLLSGTGLGPRSYSIIEQGTISRLVESKPAELRGFIEDAAGISKYKERKRDTLNRIRNSRENLSRLNDLHHELTAQIESLESQAIEAKKYSSLKEQERTLNTNIVVFRWQSFNKELMQTQMTLDEANQELLMFEQRLLEFNTNDSTQKIQLKDIQVELDHINNKFHQHQEKITHLTLGIEHKTQARQQQQHQLEQLVLKKDKAAVQLIQAEIQRENNDNTLAAANIDVSPLLLSQSELKIEQDSNDQKNELIETKIFSLTHEKQKLLGEQQLYKQQIDGLNNQQLKTQSQIDLLNKKRIELATQQQKLKPIVRSNEFQQAQLRLQQIQTDTECAKDLMIEYQDSQQLLQQTLRDDNQNLAILEQALKGIESQINGLSHQDNDTLMEKFDEVSQLWTHITVAQPWQTACDVILTHVLNGFVIDKAPVIDLGINENLPSHCQLWSTTQTTPVHELSLVHFITSSHQNTENILTAILSNVLCVETHQQAVDLQSTLKDYQQIITQRGDIYTRYGYWHYSATTDNKTGLVSLNENYSQLSIDIDNKKSIIKQTIEKIATQVTLVDNSTDAYEKCIVSSQTHLDIVNMTKQQWLLEQQQWEHVSSQLEEVNQQVEELTNHGIIDKIAIESLQQLTLSINDKLLLSDNKLELLKQEKVVGKQVSKQLQKKLDRLLSDIHQNQLIIQKLEMQLSNDVKHVTLLSDNIKNINEEYLDINTVYCEAEEPLNNQKKTLIDLKAAQQTLSNTKSSLSLELQKLNESQSEHVKKVQSTFNDKNKHEKLVQKLNVKHETLKVKMQSQTLQISLNERKISELAEKLTDIEDVKLWPEQLNLIRDQLANIGAINLTAIEQYNLQKARLDELTRQCDDLEEGLSTLEKAIKKIDRQSREKFKKTFDSVNVDFQRLFPKVFGGGSAQLTLTDSDLLLAGVSIMAQPPGKKNSTIHLLSGGEKALTALSLVFAIFQLNPAPFCMLDEVDAPLDDANVDRYCNLVKEMSEKVQFIYITHNKVSMEMATQLTGVTMQEAGVSRIVAVDVDAAISMVQQ